MIPSLWVACLSPRRAAPARRAAPPGRTWLPSPPRPAPARAHAYAPPLKLRAEGIPPAAMQNRTRLGPPSTPILEQAWPGRPRNATCESGRAASPSRGRPSPAELLPLAVDRPTPTARPTVDPAADAKRNASPQPDIRRVTPPAKAERGRGWSPVRFAAGGTGTRVGGAPCPVGWHWRFASAVAGGRRGGPGRARRGRRPASGVASNATADGPRRPGGVPRSRTGGTPVTRRRARRGCEPSPRRRRRGRRRRRVVRRPDRLVDDYGNCGGPLLRVLHLGRGGSAVRAERGRRF